MTRQATIYLGVDGAETKIASILESCGFDGATITRATGVWRRELELSYVLTLLNLDEDVTDNTFELAARAAARDLRHAFDQDAVIVTFQDVDVFTAERSHS